MRLLKCINCSHNDGNTQIRIKSSCFDKPLIINISSEDESYQALEQMISVLMTKKKEREECRENVVLSEI